MLLVTLYLYESYSLADLPYFKQQGKAMNSESFPFVDEIAIRTFDILSHHCIEKSITYYLVKVPLKEHVYFCWVPRITFFDAWKENVFSVIQYVEVS